MENLVVCLDKEYKEKITERDNFILSKMIPVRFSEKVIYFRHYLFETYKIFVFTTKPEIQDLKNIKLSKIEISEYINHKNYKRDGVNGRCKVLYDTKTIIISVNNFNIQSTASISTLVHELTHCTHRLFESKKHIFSEEGFCTLLGDLTEITLNGLAGNKDSIKDLDLIWNRLMIFSQK